MEPSADLARQGTEDVVEGRHRALVEIADRKMVLEVLANRRGVQQGRDAERLEQRRRADAGQLQQLWRVDRAPAEDDFARGTDLFEPTPATIFHPDCAPPLEQDAGGMRFRPQDEVATPERGAEIFVGGRGAATVAGVEVEHPDAFAAFAIEVGRGSKTERFARRDESPAQRVGEVGNVADPLRPARAVPVAGAVVVILGLDEIGQHVGPAPTAIARRRPVVKIVRLAADMDHRVDRSGSADDLAARPVAGATVEPGDRVGIVHPVDARIEEGPAIADRQLDPDRPVGSPRLDQQHARLAVRRQPVGQHAAGRPGADDDIVVSIVHQAGCWVISRWSMEPV